MNVSASGHPAFYNIEIDKVDEKKWAELLMLFDDASIHQTWSSGVIKKGKNNLSHLVLKKGGQIVGISQVTIKKVPLLNAGFADVYNGPLWRKKGSDGNIENFQQMINCLKNEYALNRGLLLRIWPNEFEDHSNEVSGILKSIGFKNNNSAPIQRTLLIDLSPSLEVLRKNLSKTWRLHLNRAEKNKLRVIEGTADDLYEIFLAELKEMVERKHFVPRVNYDQYRIIQKELPDNFKMRIMACEFEAKLVCTIICSAIGNTGLFLFGATANAGLESYASNLLHWRMIMWLKENGYKWYDLGGINPEENPGTYQFKRGLSGALGQNQTKIGQYDFYNNHRANLLSKLIRGIILLRRRIHAMRSSLIKSYKPFLKVLTIGRR